MEIVIKIPEEKYKAIQKCFESGFTLGLLDMAVLHGTPLPKGHGALKDVDKIEEAFWNNSLINKNMDSLDNGESNKMRRAMIRTMHLDVPTIVRSRQGRK